jgi:hypothetical protein
MNRGNPLPADVVHELVNLLGVVLTHAQLARFTQSEAALREGLQEIEAAARAAVELLGPESPPTR